MQPHQHQPPHPGFPYPPEPDVMQRRIEALERRIEMLERIVLAMPAPSSQSSGFLDQLARTSEPLNAMPPIQRLPPPERPWVAVLHTMDRNDPDWPVKPCGGVGVWLTRPIREGERASFDVLRILPPGEMLWRAPTIHDEPRCQSCHALIDPFSSADLDYLSILRPAAEGRRQAPAPTPDSEPSGTTPPQNVVPDESDGAPPLPPYVTPEASAEALNTLSKLSRDIFG